MKTIKLSTQGENSDSCENCRLNQPLSFDFSMAFQPIVELSSRSVYAYESLVRGMKGEGAPTVLKQVHPGNKSSFDQLCRRKSVELASILGMSTRLSINFLPSAVQDADMCLRQTLAVADRCNFPHDKLMFEAVENERYHDAQHIKSIFQEYRCRNITTAIDDFGSGYASFDAIIELNPHVVKIDMALIRDIDSSRRKQIVVQGIASICHALGARPLAEGVETLAELEFLDKLGIDLYQGYLFARPAFMELPPVNWPISSH